MQSAANKLRCMYPARDHETKCLYVYGKPGTGKTTTIKRVLRAIHSYDSRFGTYVKVGGMSKFWENYDNEFFVLFDDPGYFSGNSAEDEVSAFKNIISNGPYCVEVKGSFAQFTSHLVIICTNAEPGNFARLAGPHEQAVCDRIAGSRSICKTAIYIPTLGYCINDFMFKFINLCIYIIYARTGIDIPFEDVILELEPIDNTFFKY